MNKYGEIVWEEWKKAAFHFHIWYTVTDRRQDRTWDDQNDDGELKSFLGCIEASPNDPSLRCS
jgi:hypothetical protein